jgi:hypothetical protein
MDRNKKNTNKYINRGRKKETKKKEERDKQISKQNKK